MPTTQDTLFIRIASEKKLLTQEQIAECRKIQKTLRQVGEERSLLEIALNKRYVSKAQAAKLEELLERDGLPKRLGEFEIISKIGKGGMGAVYKAYQASMDRDVALKVLSVELSEDESLVSRFHREAKSVGRLNHPNVVSGIVAGESGGYHYFAMEYVEGEDLSSILAKGGKSGKGKLEVLEAVGIILQVSKGLAAAHEQNIIHRDIKPANVLITKDGTAKLADLGLAKRLNVADMSSVTRTGQMMGTPYYMSPEQIADPKSVDHRCDIYSLGAMFYHLLTGEMPYSGDSLYEVIQKHQTAPIPWPADVDPQIPIVACEIVQTMLAKSPDDRHQSAGEIVQELEAFIEADNVAQAQSGDVSGEEAYVIPEEEIAALEESLKGTEGPSSEKLSHAKKKAEVSVPSGDLKESARAKSRLSRRAIVGLLGCVIASLAMVIFIAVVLLHKPKDKAKPARTAERKHRETSQPKGGNKRESVSTSTRLPKWLKAKPGPKIDKDTGLAVEVISEKDGAEMVLIPAGEFEMGSDDGFAHEQPVHKVYLDTFYIDKYEVANAQYRKFVNATGHLKPVLWNNPNFNAPKQPVVGVYWGDAAAYARWAGKRLPTEAEWEKAARGTDSRRYPWGNDEPDETKANFDNKVGKTTEIGSYPQGVSPYGCYDMAGNVWEWCADWYSASYYMESPRENPKGPDSGDVRVLRGGGWNSPPGYIRASNRSSTILRTGTATTVFVAQDSLPLSPFTPLPLTARSAVEIFEDHLCLLVFIRGRNLVIAC